MGRVLLWGLKWYHIRVKKNPKDSNLFEEFISGNVPTRENPFLTGKSLSDYGGLKQEFTKEIDKLFFKLDIDTRKQGSLLVGVSKTQNNSIILVSVFHEPVIPQSYHRINTPFENLNLNLPPELGVKLLNKLGENQKTIDLKLTTTMNFKQEIDYVRIPIHLSEWSFDIINEKDLLSFNVEGSTLSQEIGYLSLNSLAGIKKPIEFPRGFVDWLEISSKLKVWWINNFEKTNKGDVHNPTNSISKFLYNLNRE